jgi:hypothetical protein
VRERPANVDSEDGRLGRELRADGRGSVRGSTRRVRRNHASRSGGDDRRQAGSEVARTRPREPLSEGLRPGRGRGRHGPPGGQRRRRGWDPARAGATVQISSSSPRTPFATSICAASGQAAGNRTAPSSSFVYVTETSSGVHVQLRAADDGHLITAPGKFGQSFTDNGVSVSPGRRDVYVTLIGHPTLKIVRIDVATGRRGSRSDRSCPLHSRLARTRHVQLPQHHRLSRPVSLIQPARDTNPPAPLSGMNWPSRTIVRPRAITVSTQPATVIPS